ATDLRTLEKGHPLLLFSLRDLGTRQFGAELVQPIVDVGLLPREHPRLIAQLAQRRLRLRQLLPEQLALLREEVFRRRFALHPGMTFDILSGQAVHELRYPGRVASPEGDFDHVGVTEGRYL